MPTLPDNFAPYAPANNVLDIIKRFRDRGLPEVLSPHELDKLQIPEGNIGRVSQCLRFLGLIEEDGLRTQKFNEIGKASTEQYPVVLGNIVRDAYHELLKYVDPAVDPEHKIADQFRHFEPASVRPRMVALFMALCREAGIIAPLSDTDNGETKSRRSTPRKTAPIVAENRRNQRPKDNSEDEPPTIQPSQTASPRKNYSESRYYLLHGLVEELPESGTWTKEEHTRWMGAMTALTSYLIKESELDNDKDTEDTM